MTEKEKSEEKKLTLKNYRVMRWYDKYFKSQDIHGMQGSLEQFYRGVGVKDESLIKETVNIALQSPKVTLDNYLGHYDREKVSYKVNDFAKLHSGYLKKRLGDAYGIFMNQVENKAKITMGDLEEIISDAQRVLSKVERGKIDRNSDEAKKAHGAIEFYGSIYELLDEGENIEIEKLRPEIKENLSKKRTEKPVEFFTKLYEAEQAANNSDYKLNKSQKKVA